MPKKRKPFTVTPYRSIDKRIEVLGPDGFRLWVDNDDVNPKTVRDGLKKMVKILNENWRNGEDIDLDTAEDKRRRERQGWMPS
jgi:hypothetical protein